MYRTACRSMLVISAVALIAACGQKVEDKTVAQQPDANPAATIPTPANEAGAPDFVAKAVASDIFEIDTSRAALEKSSSAEVKKFAQEMIDAHSKSGNDLKAAIATAGLTITPDTNLPKDKADKVAELRDTDAKDFDKAYLNAQVDAHQATLDLMQRYANDGDNAALKAFAAATAPVVQAHYDHAKALRDALK